MELQLEPKNSRAPNPYGSFPWMLGEELCEMRQFKTLLNLLLQVLTQLCVEGILETSLTSPSLHVHRRFTLSAPTNDHHQQCDNDFINICKFECFGFFQNATAVKQSLQVFCFSDVCQRPPPLQVYTCDSGACIDLANKCNSKIECTDESDETNCQYLEV